MKKRIRFSENFIKIIDYSALDEYWGICNYIKNMYLDRGDKSLFAVIEDATRNIESLEMMGFSDEGELRKAIFNSMNNIKENALNNYLHDFVITLEGEENSINQAKEIIFSDLCNYIRNVPINFSEPCSKLLERLDNHFEKLLNETLDLYPEMKILKE